MKGAWVCRDGVRGPLPLLAPSEPVHGPLTDHALTRPIGMARVRCHQGAQRAYGCNEPSEGYLRPESLRSALPQCMGSLMPFTSPQSEASRIAVSHAAQLDYTGAMCWAAKGSHPRTSAVHDTQCSVTSESRLSSVSLLDHGPSCSKTRRE